MALLWPGLLLLLAALPLLVGLYVWILRRRRRFAVRYSSLSLVRAALPRHSWVRRHVPFALFLLAFASLILASARPVAMVPVPAGQATVVLALDVSRSMLANDIPPSRIAAAQDAALSFVADREPGTQIGIVAFAGFAEMVQPPTTDQEALEATILGLSTARRTAIGAGILEALDVIAGMDAASVATDSEPSAPQATPGEYAPHIIVLLTDGVNSTGPEPIEAAQAAAERGIRIYTIGFGTENGGDIPGGGWGGGFRRGIDEATLQRVAEMTGGTYYAAESASELRQVFRELPVYFATRTETQEISVIFTALGALLAAVSVGLSVVWNRLL